MLKACIINYFTYFKNFFKCLGIISLAVLIFFVVLEVSFYIPFKNNDLANFNEFVEDITIYVNALSIDDLLNASFLSNTLKDVYSIFNDHNTNFTLGTILIVLSLLIIVGSYVYSQYQCKKSIREDLTTKDTIKTRNQILVKCGVNIVFWVIFFIISYYWFYAMFLLPIIIVFFESLKVIITNWIIYYRKYKISQTLNPLNVIRLLVTNLILMYIHYRLFIHLAPHINFYILLLLVISFMAYYTSISEFTATKYFATRRRLHKLKIAKKKEATT